VIVHVAYYTFLLKAYSYGDLSHTYPIARGMGPLLVAMVSGQLIGEHLRTQDIVGVVLLSGGLITLAIPLKAALPKPGSRHGLADAVRHADRSHHRRLHHRRWHGRARGGAGLRASAGLHRLAVRAGRGRGCWCWPSSCGPTRYGRTSSGTGGSACSAA
jgi:hypothetical protein